MNEPRQKGRDKNASEASAALMRRVLQTGRPKRSCVSELCLLLLLLLNRCILKSFHWKTTERKSWKTAEETGSESLKTSKDGGFTQLRPSEGGWGGGAGVQIKTSGSWVLYADLTDALEDGLQTRTWCWRLIRTGFSMQTSVFDVYLIILGALSRSAAPSVTSVMYIMTNLWQGDGKREKRAELWRF